jgi:hypothetical protein
MSQEKPYPSINQYLQESGQSVNDLLAGTNFFGYSSSGRSCQDRN